MREQVDAAIVRVLLPQCYEAIKQLMACKGPVPKDLEIKIKRLLPQSK